MTLKFTADPQKPILDTSVVPTFGKKDIELVINKYCGRMEKIVTAPVVIIAVASCGYARPFLPLAIEVIVQR